MVVVVIAILGLLVVHAAGKVTATATIAAGGDPNPLPPVSSVAATGATSNVSPATWGGGPGSASSWAIKVNTNSVYPGASSVGLINSANPGQPGVPVPFVKKINWNGFDSVPAATKQLSVNRMPGRTLNSQRFGGTKV